MNAIALRFGRIFGNGPATTTRPVPVHAVDQALVWVTVALLCFGTVMVYSASVALPDNPRFANYSHAHFLYRHVIFIALSLIAAIVAFQVPLTFWEKIAPWLIVFSLVFLIVVLVPHVGTGVNGAHLCIGLGFMYFQPS